MFKEEERDFSWKTTPHKAFIQYLHIINPLLGDKKLTNQEIEVLGAYIYIDYEYRHLPENTRNAIIFSRYSKRKLVEKLKSTNDSINNIISSLYRKGYLSKDKKLLTVVPLKEDKISISYKTSLTEDKDEILSKEEVDDKEMERSLL